MTITGGHPGTVNVSTAADERKANERQTEMNIMLPSSMYNSSTSTVSEGTNSLMNSTNSGRRLLEDNRSKREGSSESEDNNKEDVHVATVENDQALNANADSSFELFCDTDEQVNEYSYDYDDYVDDGMWGDEEWTEGQYEKLEDYVNIDSYLLCTLVIADIANYGVSEMVVAVSYFSDHEQVIFMVLQLLRNGGPFLVNLSSAVVSPIRKQTSIIY